MRRFAAGEGTKFIAQTVSDDAKPLGYLPSGVDAIFIL